jgi:osmotically inducible lipoprotein OsmB
MQHLSDIPGKTGVSEMMKKFAVSALLVASAVSMSACSTLKGAGIGAAGGAGVAAATGGSVEKGAAVGGAGGAVVGTVAD